MDAALGHEADALKFFAALAEAPFNYDFYQTLRRLECLYPGKPRWGCAPRPVDEPVRLGQDPDLSFAPAPLASFDPGWEGQHPRLLVRLFGLLGPNGPLPIHITEYARERLRQSPHDPTLSRFLDLFHHRFLLLFYRAWAQAQPHVNRDRPSQDRFAAYIGAFSGLAPAAFRDRDSVPDLAKFFHAGILARHVRSPEGLAAILQHFFSIPVRIEQFVGQWLLVDERDRTLLGRAGGALGLGAILGKSVWDRQYKFRIHLGPLTLAQYESFLPMPEKTGGDGPPGRSANAGDGTSRPTLLDKLVDWVRLYLCFELDWDVRLLLRRDEVPPLRVGAGARLGWTTWLGKRRSAADADDVIVDAEKFVDPDRAVA
jgi:type VI secretion system protein ImpH